MKPINNIEHILPFLSEESDGDTFWYTEILDRSKRTGGDNRRRLFKFFRHKDKQNLIDCMPQIISLCEAAKARAYIRLSPRSEKSVAKQLLTLTTEMVVNEAWNSAAHLYPRACGRTNIRKKLLWLYDIDLVNDQSEALKAFLIERGFFVSLIPSKKGEHFIVKPHDPRIDSEYIKGDISIHKDNPTNLYIPGE